MCGNGARALTHYAYEQRIAASPMRFATGSGTVEAEVEPPFVELDMGNIDLARGTFGWSLRAGGVTFPFVFLNVGVPHCVLLTDEDYSRDAMREMGREVRGQDTSNRHILPAFGGLCLKSSPRLLRSFTG